MNARQTTPASSTAHPAPHRRNIPSLPMWFGLLAAPLAWIGDELAGYFIASRKCGMESADNAGALVTATSPWFITLTVVTALIALAGLFVSIRNWRHARNEDRGSGDHLLELGRGRTRFMAMWGLLTSISFLIAFVFTIAFMVTAPLCGK